jgi:nitrate reductase gamma subunit
MGMMMVASFVIAPIAGILLALRFKVLVLIPASLLAAVVIVVSSHQPKLTIALTVVGTAVLLQIGYIVGLIARALLQRRSMARSSDSFSKSIGALVHLGRSKKPVTTRAEKRHLVQ